MKKTHRLGPVPGLIVAYGAVVLPGFFGAVGLTAWLRGRVAFACALGAPAAADQSATAVLEDRWRQDRRVPYRTPNAR